MSIQYPIDLQPLSTGQLNRRRPARAKDYASADNSDPGCVEALNFLHRKQRTLIGGITFDSGNPFTTTSTTETTTCDTNSDSIDLDEVEVGGFLTRELVDSNGDVIYEVEVGMYGQQAKLHYNIYKRGAGGGSLLVGSSISVSGTSEQWTTARHTFLNDNLDDSDYISANFGVEYVGSTDYARVYSIALAESDITDPKTQAKQKIYSP